MILLICAYHNNPRHLRSIACPATALQEAPATLHSFCKKHNQMKNYIITAFAAFIAIVSCSKSDTDIPGTQEPPIVADTVLYNENPILYSGLAVGQKSTYVLLEGRQYHNDTILDDFNYLPDTLVAEIIGKDENGFLVYEYLTEGSAESPLPDHLTPDFSFQYYLKAEGDYLYFFDLDDDNYLNSSLFWGWEDSLDLNLFVQKVDIEGWKTTLPYCECEQMGYDPSFELFGITYEDMNISIRNKEMQADGPGTTYMYSRKYGMVRSSQYSWWSQTGHGWDLLGVQ